MTHRRAAGARRRRVGVVAAVVAALLAASLAACSPGGPAPTKGDVVLAVALPLTGVYADSGTSIADGVRLAAERRNASGGLLGRRVVVEVFDDKASTADAVATAERVVASDAKAVVGHYNSGVSIAAAPVYAGKVLMITPTSTRPELTQLGIDTLFRVSANDTAQGPALAGLLAADGRVRPALMYEQGSAYAEGLSRFVTDALDAAGDPPVTAQTFTSATRDYAPQLEAVKASGADALVLVASAQQGAEIARQARELGVDVPLYGGDSLAKFEFPLRAGSAAEGAKITALWPDRVTGDDRDEALVREFRERFGRNPGFDTPAGVAAAEVWFRGVEQADSFEPAAVAAALKADGFEVDSPVGAISYDAKGDRRDQKLFVQRITQRRFVPD